MTTRATLDEGRASSRDDDRPTGRDAVGRRLRRRDQPRLLGAFPNGDGTADYALELSSALQVLVTREVQDPPPDLRSFIGGNAMDALERTDGLEATHADLKAHVARLASDARGKGSTMAFERLYLAEPLQWKDGRTPLFTAALTSLGHGLRPERAWINGLDREGLTSSFAEASERHARRAAKRAFLAERGAHGIVDQIGAQVILSDPRPDQVASRLRAASMVFLEGGFILEWSEGLVTSRGGDSGRGWWSHGDDFHVEGYRLPPTSGIASAGRPVRDVIEHPLLDHAMKISRVEMGDRRTRIRLLPRPHLINLDVASAWPMPDEDACVWQELRSARVY